MTGNDARREDEDQWWVIGPDRGSTNWVDVSSHMAEDLKVRLGQTEKGRLFVTGLRIGAPDGLEPYEITNLRDIHLGEILRAIREAAAIDNPAWQSTLLARANPAKATVRRGPVPDADTDLRTRELYEAALAAGSSKMEAIAATAAELDRDQATIYRRLARTRPKEDS